MIGYIEYLGILGFKIGLETQIDLIMQSLNNNYSQFVMNNEINEIDITSTELWSMLRTAVSNMINAWTTPIMMVNIGMQKGMEIGKKEEDLDLILRPNYSPILNRLWGLNEVLLKKTIVASMENRMTGS